MNDWKKLNYFSELLDEEHLPFFTYLVDSYKEELNQRIVSNEIYTLHDFDHHCYNIYDILGRILIRKKGVLNSTELYLLAISVLFHDIAMQTRGFDRNKHSMQSAIRFKDEAENKDTPLAKKAGLTQQHINAVYHIILAHSDCIELKEIHRGVNNPDLKSINTGEGVRTLLLAGLLRIADELDVTCTRIGNTREEIGMDPENANHLESKRHWEKLHYFSEIIPNDKNIHILDLVCDDEYISTPIDSGDLQNVYEVCISVRDEINKKLSEIADKIFASPQMNASSFAFKEIQVQTNNNSLYNKIYRQVLDFKTNDSADNSNNKGNNDQDAKEITNGILAEIIEPSFDRYLHKYVLNKNLLSFGHYVLNDRYCSRDWINTSEIIHTEDIFHEAANLIGIDIKKQLQLIPEKRILIVGVGTRGSFLSGRLGFNLQLPFSYAIPISRSRNEGLIPNDDCIFKPSNFEAILEKEEYEKYDGIIILTDVICTWGTIVSIIDENHLWEKVHAVYTVFYRNILGEFKYDKKVSALFKNKKVFALNNSFQSEVIDASTCMYKINSGCVADNKPLEM